MDEIIALYLALWINIKRIKVEGDVD